ncbi:hypothetical protein AAFF_G00094170 [Aldrovandia affinis]|uniref:Uncharacterized protein n=1 Tax=Aldrovandia affinis TaxID=143900 RepID=A0AAD7T4Q6_9TELE|nr:hypothetical protein AAFF_G00094170 [Aldrovandia affinis]
MAGAKLVPVLGTYRGDCRSSGFQLFNDRSPEGVGPIITCANMRLAKLSGASKLTHNSPTRRRNPGSRCLPDKSKEVKGLERNCMYDGPTCSFISSRDDPKFASVGIEHNITDIDICGRNFQFYKKWPNEGTDYKYDFTEKRVSKPNSFIPPLPRDYQVQRSNHINRFTPLRELSHGPPKPFSPGSYEGYDLSPGIVLPATVHPFGGKPSFITDAHINRPRINNQLSGLSANKKSYTYADPVCGASASFVQRLSEISSLEGETIRQESLKKLKKTKRLES